MNRNNYLYYLIFTGLFCTPTYDILASSEHIQSSVKETTTTTITTPEKKENSEENTTPSDENIKDNQEFVPSAIVPSTDTKTCPHVDIPLEKLSTIQLEELLDCKQQQKNTITTTVEKIEKVLEKKDPKKQPSKKTAKKKDRCPYGSIPLKKLKADQLEEIYAYTLKHTMDAPFMIDLLIRLIALSDNHAGVKEYKLKLADTYYNAHHIEKAAAHYEDFAVLYPSSKETEYVLYKAVACMFELSLDADRDQTNTKKSIALVKEFLKYAKKLELIEEAKTILKTCYHRLYEHEVYVFNFYLKKKNFDAAQLRIEYIKKSFTETIDNLTEKVEKLTKELQSVKHPVKKPLWGLGSAPAEFTDNGPVDTTKNRAAKFLA